MKVKKLLSASLAIAMLATSALGVMAEDATITEDPATNPIVGNAILGTPASDVTANFTYDTDADASATVTVDVDDNVKTVVYDENYDDLAVDATATSVNNGSDYYGGTVGTTAAVVDNPVRDTEDDNCIEIGNWKENVFNVYDGTSYDATFWFKGYNPTDWDRYDIRIKKDVFLAYRGTSCTSGDGGNWVGLYLGYADPGSNPNANLDNGQYTRKAYVNIADYGYSITDGAYWRIVATYNSVKVYINSTSDFTNVKPIMDVTLDGNKVGERSLLGFAAGSEPMYIDDVTVNEIGTTPITEGDEKGKLVKDVDFETHESPIDDGDYNDTVVEHVSNGNGRFRLTADNKGRTVTMVPKVIGDYTATFFLKVANNQYHQMDLYVRDRWSLRFRGYNHYDATNKVNGVHLHDGSSNVTSASMPNLQNGAYIKYEYINDTLKLWAVAASSFTGEFTGDPILTYTFETSRTNYSDWKFYRWDDSVSFDDIKLTATDGTVIYENNFDMYTYNATNATIVTDETTGSSVYWRAQTYNWDNTTQTLFSTPENYEMTYWVRPSTQDYCISQVYLKNNINIRIYGKGHHTYDSLEENPITNPVIALCDGSTDLDYVATYTIAGMGAEPFKNGGWFKARFVGNNVKVYMATTDAFSDEVLLFDYTFEDFEATDNTVKIYAKNEPVQFDNFKVYDLDNTGTNIGAGYKQVVLNGTDVKLVDVVDGVATEIGAYTLPLADARYRISVAKANGKLTVYVNGKVAIETDSTAAGLMYFDGKNYPTTVIGTDAPIVISAGDLDYNESVNADDLLKMKKILLGLDKTVYVTEAVNADGDAELEVDIRDFIRIKKIIAGVA